MRILPRDATRSQSHTGLDAEPSLPILDRPAGVLWVDDDPQFTARARTLAEQSLLHLHVARTPDEASEIVAIYGSEIVAGFLNIDLLGEPSTEAWLTETRAHPKARRIPLAFLSARDDLRTRVWAAHEGARLFLNTPVDPTELSQAINQLVALRRAARPSILIVDEDRDFAGALSDQLNAYGMQSVALDDASQLLTQLQCSDPDAVIVDAQTPDINGFDLCRVLRTHSRWQDLPVLIMGRDNRLGARLAAFEAGSDDFLPRHSAPAEFLVRIQTHIERSRMMRERADRDPLTGLLTRRALLESLAARLSEVSRKKQNLAFCLLDLDHFKRINDTHGHLAGDRVLAGLGRLLQNRFRVEDLRGRWGGEEFVVVMANEGMHNARTILERIRREFAELDFQAVNGENFRVSFSAGIAEFPTHGRDVEAIFSTADRHLYAAKAAGRNRIIRTPQIN